MREIYLALIILIAAGTMGAWAAEDDGVSFDEFSMNLGDRVDIGDLRLELVDIQSVRDGLTVIRVSEKAGKFDEQRILLVNSPNNFKGGSEDGGLTVTVVNIFDEESAKVRLEYPSSMGTPRKRASETPAASRAAPNLIVQKTLDSQRVSVGDEVKVSIIVRNIGTDTATNLQIYDQPPLPEFAYLAGYPPKLRSELGPGESDSSAYVMQAVKAGLVKVPSIEVRYADSKKKARSNNSESLEITIDPPRLPNLEVYLSPTTQVKPGETASLNLTLHNSGQAAATRIEVRSEVRPQDIVLTGLDRSFFEILPGKSESYSGTVRGERSGNYTVTVEISYSSGESTNVKRVTADVLVLEREYKYLYYLLVIPIAIVVGWIYKRHKQYKY
ncbi:MAG: Translocon-associated protein beta (TRAPB) [Methanosaeta sp. PtaB.Bin039]|nr:MAG: Translocon-associated protein beta (TRAPB) [Methanosaeta sp. PtaB.Bin039]OPY44583.1 MAG: Translocon-associated protein beta (TRAPB) [Methanosaeta sp. PtaU1.Bin028]HOT06427.1 BatD family protein [Methanotrichaceae archaeon]HQF16198.1 BatD family protein [Methanotrichaceae archaeon]HQI90934.1 BatD family protein [Methanotrichaceae archaeon]